MKAAIYCRVSTDAQELEQQIKACQNYCDYKHIEYSTFGEIGSGKDFNRPLLRDCIQRIKAGEFTSLVCFRWDRLGRNAREVVTLFEDLEDRGIPIISLNENIDTTTPMGRFARDIILRLAQLERENISEATKQRLTALKNLGRKLGRPSGSKDKKKRKTSGYIQRWVNKGGSKIKKDLERDNLKFDK
jgi:site-specific DNA recombinase